MFGKIMKQADAELQADVPAAEPNRWLELARTVASGIGGVQASDVKVTNSGAHFWISNGAQRVNGFQVWVTRVWEEKDAGKPVGQRTLYLEWDDSAIDGLGPQSADGQDEGLGSLVKDFLKARKGVPGYETYVTFLRAFSAEISRVEPTARVRTKIPQ